MTLPTRSSLDAARIQSARLRRQMIAAQEELDWRCYRLYGLLPAGSVESDFEHPAPPEVALGERAFEIVMARRILEAHSTSTKWFECAGHRPRSGRHPSVTGQTTISRRGAASHFALIESKP
jgi:hypothetical protein